MPISAWLVDALVERLQQVVPAGFVVSSDAATGVGIGRAETPFWLVQAIEPILNQEGDFVENVETAVYSVLSGIQDFIAEHLALPWPGEQTMPLPNTRVRNGYLELWFGPEENPVLRLGSIALPT